MIIRVDQAENGKYDTAIQFTSNDDMERMYEDLFSGAIEEALLDTIIQVRNFRIEHSEKEIRKIF